MQQAAYSLENHLAKNISLVYEDLPGQAWVPCEDNLLTTKLQANCAAILLCQAVHKLQGTSQEVESHFAAWTCKLPLWVTVNSVGTSYDQWNQSRWPLACGPVSTCPPCMHATPGGNPTGSGATTRCMRARESAAVDAADNPRARDCVTLSTRVSASVPSLLSWALF